jgi:hypothetical protein
MKLRDERAVEYEKYKNEEIDMEDLTKGPKPWLNPSFPANKSVLPVQLDWIRREYPFEVSVGTKVPMPDASPVLLKDNPLIHKSILWIEMDGIKDMTDFEKEIMLEIAGKQRYDPRKGILKFVCNQFPSRTANENRVFQYLDYCRSQARLLAKRFEEERRQAGQTEQQ